ncbi:hypothetical protein M9Y10_027980 [Tritrichomonas musculus]|uniref:F5/8 type C domain-containing protein n=1 Tax=Tritrichomonas musculus TaxID=1915356 RepID=A0ABR2KJ31_9EUKA
MPSFCLSGGGLKNINWELLSDDFTFIIDEPFTTFTTNKILADFISPNVAVLHSTEVTISEYHIHKCDPEIFNKILNLLKGEKVDFDYQSLDKVYQIAKNIGNQEIINFVESQQKEPLSIKNVIERIICQANNHRYIDPQLINFAALNICEIPKEKIYTLDVDILSMIFSNQHLCIFSEDYLFDMICDLFTLNQDNSDLFQYIIFNNLKEESISKFTILVPFEFLSPRIWSSLSSLFFKSSSSSAQNLCLNNSILNCPNKDRYRALFFDYDESNEVKVKNQNNEDEIHDDTNDDTNEDTLNNIASNQNETARLNIPDFSDDGGIEEFHTNRFNGIINYLSEKFDGNVSKLNVIDITSSGVNKNHPLRTVDWVVDYDDNDHYFQSNNEPNAWICFDFKDMSISPTKYALKSRSDFGSGSDNLKSWVVEGSNDKMRWTILDERRDTEVLNGAGLECVFGMNMKTEKVKYYKYLRIRSIGPMISGFYNMTIAAVEFYGFLIGCL